MPLTYGRISTDDPKGIIKVYIGEGELTNDIEAKAAFKLGKEETDFLKLTFLPVSIKTGHR